MIESMNDYIFVRDYSHTYIARYKGKTASATSGPKLAAERVAKKVLCVPEVEVVRVKGDCGACGRYAFKVVGY
jgi:hypothetical protein